MLAEARRDVVRLTIEAALMHDRNIAEQQALAKKCSLADVALVTATLAHKAEMAAGVEATIELEDLHQKTLAELRVAVLAHSVLTEDLRRTG